MTMLRTTALFLGVFITMPFIGSTARGAGSDDVASASETPAIVNPKLTNDAVAYYRKLSAPIEDLKAANYQYLRAVTRVRKAKSIERSRQELLKTIVKQQEHVKRSSPFDEDTTLLSEFGRYLDLVYHILKEDFGKIVDMEDIEAQSYDQQEAHQLALDKAAEKMRASHDVAKQAEKEFFRKYGITVSEQKDELSLKIEKANSALAYYNDINRLFIKVNKQDNYVRKAIAEKDVAALEQHVATLVAFAEEGLEKLKSKKDYEGDNTLLETVQNIIGFYLQEARKTYAANMKFHFKTDHYENTLKQFNAIRQNERTKKDVDEYNKAVKNYNQSVKEINSINSISYKSHKQLIDGWNKAVERFFDRHT
jgi:hypothetical protein